MPSSAKACQLVARAYDPAVLAGSPPDLSDLGFATLELLYGTDQNGAEAVYGFLAQGPNEQVLAIRGTLDTIEWVEDAEVYLRTNPWQGAPGRVHDGFSRLAATLTLGADRTPLKQALGPLSTLSVAGHSLGAALARQVSMLLGKVAGVYTWGEPRSCDGTAAAYAVTCATVQHRGVNERDLVPMVPEYIPVLFEYVHAGEEIALGNVGTDAASAHNILTYLELEQGFIQP